MAALLLAAGRCSADVFDIGGHSVNIPAPAGCVRIDGKNPAYDGPIRQGIGRYNRLLALYGLQGDADRLSQGLRPEGATYQLQVAKQAEEAICSAADFAEARREFRTEFAKSPSYEAPVGGGSMQANMNGMLILDDNSNSIAFAGPVHGQIIDASGTMQQIDMSVAGAMVNAGGRVVLLYADGRANNPADLEWAKTAVLQWRNQVVAANPGPPATSSLFDRINWPRVGRGAAIGALVGLVTTFLRKRGR